MFATSLEDAKSKYDVRKDSDPFPTIAPALLNSAEIMKYVESTGMIYPFYVNKNDNFKPASYSMSFSGEYIYWDGKNKRFQGKPDIDNSKGFRLKSNSIAYVGLEPYIQLPNYIAARFNLHIRHVYKGLLLGTGPLVDPGYTGYLYFPLHNLTNNDYVLKPGEKLIWMEFTKINSPTDIEKNETNILNSRFISFPKKDKADLTLPDLIHKAHPNEPIVSSLQVYIEEARKLERKTRNSIREVKTTNFIALFGVVIAISAALWQLFTVNAKVMDYAKELDGTRSAIIDTLKKSLIQKDSAIKNLKVRVNHLEARQ